MYLDSFAACAKRSSINPRITTRLPKTVFRRWRSPSSLKMSSADAGSEIAQIITLYDAIYTTETCTYAVLALIAFEYILTFRQEVDMFWNRRLTGATGLFLLNRYIIIIFLILAITPSGQSETVCAKLVKSATMFEYLMYLPWAVFAALRAYALAARKWFIGLFVLLLGLVPFAVNVAVFGLGITGIVDPLFGCQGVTVNLSPELAQRFTITSRTALITADILLIVLTWRKLPASSRSWSRVPSLTSVMFHHGLIYFVILFILNVLHLIFTMISIELSPTGPSSFITIFTNPLTCILVSRFLLDLQGATRKSLHLGSQIGGYTDTADVRTKSTIVFERVVGSIASTLEPRINDDITLEEDENVELGSTDRDELGGKEMTS
ncbi:hypothetical protein L226DRAFT_563849 [Lentinus tigrinus ALCF2SS1-7]|uniref:uncharacterized protein n=1 Tax=Lentinus tigrinus ALCF2SS1-7 TaxID=1328758 RepID=UPI001165DFF3|nr:hypothetical protein L226DRAFT_563849 [Lentinus tigrinus ALCF2SS1-7]